MHEHLTYSDCAGFSVDAVVIAHRHSGDRLEPGPQDQGKLVRRRDHVVVHAIGDRLEDREPAAAGIDADHLAGER